MCVAKTKALTSFAVTAKLVCVFVFAYAKCCFSHDAAHVFLGRAFFACLWAFKQNKVLIEVCFIQRPSTLYATP